MIRSIRKTYPIYVLTDLFFMLISFFVPYFFRYNTFSNISVRLRLPNFTEYCFIFCFWAILLVVAFRKKRLYSTERNIHIPKEIWLVIKHVSFVSILIGSMIFFMKFKFFSRYVFILNVVLLIFFTASWRVIKRLILRKLIRKGFNNVNVLLIGADNDNCRMLLAEIAMQPYLGLKLVGVLDENKTGRIDGLTVLGKLSDFVRVAKKYFIEDVIVTSSITNEAIANLINQARQMRLAVRVMPERLEDPLPILGISYCGVVPLLTYQIMDRHVSEVISKRLFDIIVSCASVIFLAPVFLIVAVIIKINSRGPVFYAQKRVGYKGRIFNFYKFRSMYKNADRLKEELSEKNESVDGVMFKIKNDPRITAVGKYLRRYSIDELPQFFNVIKGDMSLVGPRPPLADEVEKYSHNHIERLSIKPGITGLSQIKGRSDLSFARWVKWDIWYINNWSFALDLRILFWTIPAVFKGRGAY